MKKFYLLILAVILIQTASFSQNFPFPQNRTYGNGLMPGNRSGADASSAYSTWKSNFLASCSNGRYRVKFDDQSQTVSEGIGYGMLMSAYAGDKTVFDGLWQYYKDNRNTNGVMNWKIGGCSGTVAANGATDAEEDVAMALIVAHYQWGSTGSVNYQSDAKTLISIIKTKEVDGSGVLKPGDMFGGSSLTNPSYFAPGYFRAFGQFTNDASFWNGVASKCYSIINGNLSKNSAAGGLVSDWCTGDGSYSSSASGYFNGGKRYHYDACRTPWRIAVDFAWYGSAEAKTYVQKTSDFVRVTLGGPKNVKDGYYQNGTAYGQWHNSSFAGGFACAAIGGENQTHLDNSYSDLKGLNDASSYYNQSLKTLYLFFLTGNFYNPVGGTVTPNVAPTVSITSPANNATFTAGANISITANAADSDGSISKVEFYRGTTLIGTSTSAPYTVTWTNAGAGTYSLTAKATDNAGAATTSTAVNITVNSSNTNTPPTASITSPANNSSFTAGANITITASASDANGSVTKVDFYNGSTLLGTATASPYTYTWTNLQAGTYTITAKATDNGGASTTSTAVNITVNTTNTNTPPTVSITNPANNASFTAGANITITASASDANGSVTKVDFYNGSTLLGTATASPYTYTWTNVQAGTYTITAKATDNGGASTTSTAVSISVNGTNTGGCVTEAIPSATDYVVRNDWSDQNNGSSVSNQNNALKITHRQWGENFLWLIEANKKTSFTAGTSYTIKFDVLSDPSVNIGSMNVALASSAGWNGPTLAQPAVAVSSGYSSSVYTTKTVTLTASATGSYLLSFKFNWAGQPNVATNNYIKNISVCETGTARLAISNSNAGNKLFPNPFNESTSVWIASDDNLPLKVKVKDMMGRPMIESMDSVTNTEFNVGEKLNPGVYILEAEYEGQKVSYKIIKQ